MASLGIENGIEEAALRSAMHGVRSADVIRALAPALDADAESERVERRQAEDTAGLRALPGAAAALEAFRPDRIAIVTSGTRPLALGRLQVVGIEAGRAAGMATVGVVTTHARAELAAADAVIGSI